MRNANLVADELHNAGFRTKIFTSKAVIVSLTNRKVSQMEVELELDKRLEGIQFELNQTLAGILVTW